MIVKSFRCLNCGNKFEAEIFEKGEAESKRLPSGPVPVSYTHLTLPTILRV